MSSWDGWRREGGTVGKGERDGEGRMNEEKEDTFCMYRLSSIPVQLVHW